MNIRSMMILLGTASLIVSSTLESRRSKLKVIMPTVDYSLEDEIKIENSLKDMFNKMVETKREKDQKKNVQKLLDTMEPDIDDIEKRINEIKRKIDEM